MSDLQELTEELMDSTLRIEFVPKKKVSVG